MRYAKRCKKTFGPIRLRDNAPNNLLTKNLIPSQPLSPAEWGKLFAGRANDAKSIGLARAMTHGLHHWSTPSCHGADGGPWCVKQTQFRAGRELLGRAPAYGAEPRYVKQTQFGPATRGREIRNSKLEIRNKSETRMTQTNTPIREPRAPNKANSPWPREAGKPEACSWLGQESEARNPRQIRNPNDPNEPAHPGASGAKQTQYPGFWPGNEDVGWSTESIASGETAWPCEGRPCRAGANGKDGRGANGAKQSQFAGAWMVGTAHATKQRGAKRANKANLGRSVPARAARENALRHHYEPGKQSQFDPARKGIRKERLTASLRTRETKPMFERQNGRNPLWRNGLW